MAFVGKTKSIIESVYESGCIDKAQSRNIKNINYVMIYPNLFIFRGSNCLDTENIFTHILKNATRRLFLYDLGY